jgi:rhamnogalacturonan endolyase
MLDGTLLWTINLGKNIREGAHYTQFMVYDLDGDGLVRVELNARLALEESRTGGDLRFSQESRSSGATAGLLGLEFLEGHVATELGVGCTVDLAHPTGANRGGDSVVCECAADHPDAIIASIPEYLGVTGPP